jgi:hypothetical protein
MTIRKDLPDSLLEAECVSPNLRYRDYGMKVTLSRPFTPEELEMSKLVCDFIASGAQPPLDATV